MLLHFIFPSKSTETAEQLFGDKATFMPSRVKMIRNASGTGVEILTWNVICKCKPDLLYAQNSIKIIARELLCHRASVTKFDRTITIRKSKHSVQHIKLYE